MKSCRILVLPDANHVVMRETDNVRAEAVETIGEFLAEIARR